MATYTKLTEEIVTKVLAGYELGNLVQFSTMDGGAANSSCIVTTQNGKYVLSVCDEKNAAELKRLTKILGYLGRNDFFTSRLVFTKKGSGYCLLGDKPVYIKGYIDGEMGGKPSVEKVAQVGEALATLHKIDAPDFIPDFFSYGIGVFEELIELGGDYGRWLEAKRQLILPYLTKDLPKGLVHGDLFWDNLLFKGDTLTAMLDFEEACHTYLLFDLGMCVAGCCSRDSKLDMELTTALIRGYQKLRGLTEKERNSLRIFIIYAATCTSFWRYRQFNILRPDLTKKDHYLEMSRLADSLQNMEVSMFDDLYL